MSEQALRYNTSKLTWSNFPLFLIRPMIKVADFGGRKYAKFNYLKGAPISQYLDCIKRHLDAFEDPEQSDIDESGENHLAHISWNALVAIYMLTHKPELDDRWKPETLTDELRVGSENMAENPIGSDIVLKD
jgi:hypothetical protein